MQLQVGLSFLINFSSHGPNPRCHFERIAVYRIQILCIEAMLDLINVMTLVITVVMYNLESLWSNFGVNDYLTLPQNRWDMDMEGSNKCWVVIRNCIKPPTGYRMECYQVCINVIKKTGAFKMDIIQCHTYSISKVFNSNQNRKLYLIVFSFEYLRNRIRHHEYCFHSCIM